MENVSHACDEKWPYRCVHKVRRMVYAHLKTTRNHPNEDEDCGHHDDAQHANRTAPTRALMCITELIEDYASDGLFVVLGDHQNKERSVPVCGKVRIASCVCGHDSHCGRNSASDNNTHNNNNKVCGRVHSVLQWCRSMGGIARAWSRASKTLRVPLGTVGNQHDALCMLHHDGTIKWCDADDLFEPTRVRQLPRICAGHGGTTVDICIITLNRRHSKHQRRSSNNIYISQCVIAALHVYPQARIAEANGRVYDRGGTARVWCFEPDVSLACGGRWTAHGPALTGYHSHQSFFHTLYPRITTTSSSSGSSGSSGHSQWRVRAHEQRHAVAIVHNPDPLLLLDSASQFVSIVPLSLNERQITSSAHSRLPIVYATTPNISRLRSDDSAIQLSGSSSSSSIISSDGAAGPHLYLGSRCVHSGRAIPSAYLLAGQPFLFPSFIAHSPSYSYTLPLYEVENWGLPVSTGNAVFGYAAMTQRLLMIDSSYCPLEQKESSPLQWKARRAQQQSLSSSLQTFSLPTAHTGGGSSSGSSSEDALTESADDSPSSSSPRSSKEGPEKEGRCVCYKYPPTEPRAGHSLECILATMRAYAAHFVAEQKLQEQLNTIHDDASDRGDSTKTTLVAKKKKQKKKKTKIKSVCADTIAKDVRVYFCEMGSSSFGTPGDPFANPRISVYGARWTCVRPSALTQKRFSNLAYFELV